MGFTDLVSDSGLLLLDKWVQTRSYIYGYGPSKADVVSFKAIAKTPEVEHFPNANRWYTHIKSYEPEFSALPGDPTKAYTAYGPDEVLVTANTGNALQPEEIGGGDEEDIDLFGSDDEEEDADVVAEREKRLEDYRKKKEAKVKPAAKSVITLDVKGYGDETDMDELKAHVLEIEMDGLTWGASKFVPVGYGIKKLQINLVVEDDKVSLDELESRLVDDLSDLVQSMEVVAMQKL